MSEPTNIIINRVVEKKSHVVNFLCLITKYFIYSQRCQGKKLHFPALKSIFNNIENMEKYIAIKNNRMYIHEAKWKLRQPIVVQDVIMQQIEQM